MIDVLSQMCFTTTHSTRLFHQSGTLLMTQQKLNNAIAVTPTNLDRKLFVNHPKTHPQRLPRLSCEAAGGFAEFIRAASTINKLMRVSQCAKTMGPFCLVGPRAGLLRLSAAPADSAY